VFSGGPCFGGALHAPLPHFIEGGRALSLRLPGSVVSAQPIPPKPLNGEIATNFICKYSRLAVSPRFETAGNSAQRFGEPTRRIAHAMAGFHHRTWKCDGLADLNDRCSCLRYRPPLQGSIAATLIQSVALHASM